MCTVAARRVIPCALATALAVGGGAGHALASGGVNSRAPTEVAISPAPGTPDASPQTQISISGIAPRSIASVSVTGSVTGRHSGHLRAYSGGRGASFVAAKPFDQGETVSAAVKLRGRPPRRFSFKIARLQQGPTVFLPLTKRQPAKLDQFVTDPNLQAPQITVLGGSAGPGGDIFLTPLPSPVVHPGSNNIVTISPVGPGGPMIVDGRGQLVWFRALASPTVATDLRVTSYRGRDVLTWWQGAVTPAAFGIGAGIVADTSYRTIATVHAGNGYAMDLHEFELTPAGDALFTIYSPVLVHLAGTPAGTTSRLLDAIVQEVDIRTGLVMWEWHCLGHIPLSDSYATPALSSSYDVFHVNAVQPLPSDRVLISARDTSAVYKVDQTTGAIVWTLGGKASSFRLGRGARFFFQHDAQMLPNGDISMFDDEAGPPLEAPSSRGLILALNQRRRVATVVRQYHYPGQASAQSEGSLQVLPGGDVFLGFGAQPYFAQFSASGRVLFDAQLPADDGSYRVYRFPWSAKPPGRPTVVAHRLDLSHISVYVSWNGATEVARWQVMAGATASSLRAATAAPKRGFETQIAVAGSAAFVSVRALDVRNRVLASSSAVPVS